MRQSRAPRVVRGLVAASVATFVALVSHVSAGAAVPGWLGIAVPWVLSAMVCTVLAGRHLSLIKLAVAVAASQLLFHTLFVLGTITATTSGSPQLPQHPHGAMQTMPGPDAAAAMAHVDPMMWIWHGFAALVTVAALYRGERAVVQLRALTVELAAWVRRQLRRPVRVPSFTPPARVLTDSVPRWHVASAPQLTLLRRRGPPLSPAL